MRQDTWMDFSIKNQNKHQTIQPSLPKKTSPWASIWCLFRLSCYEDTFESSDNDNNNRKNLCFCKYVLKKKKKVRLKCVWFKVKTPSEVLWRYTMTHFFPHHPWNTIHYTDHGSTAGCECLETTKILRALSWS